MGENLSIPGMDDENTCIGDIYRMGSVEVQVSEPRMPCWKISQLFDEKKLLRLILRRPITGWYFRVLRPGALVIGDPVKRVYRPSNSLSIADLVRLDQARQPQAVQLHRAAATEGLNEDWRQRLRQRAEKAVRP
jgi:MOSC domain-containing protein YiiM